MIIAKSAFEAALFDLQALSEDKMDETLRAMQLLRDNYRLWEIDIKAIKDKLKEAGHYIDGDEGAEYIEEVEKKQQEMAPKKQKLNDSLFGEEA